MLAQCSSDGLSVGEWLPLLNDQGLLSTESHVRAATLRCVSHYMHCCSSVMITNLHSNPLVSSRLWLCQYDCNEECATAGQLLYRFWCENNRSESVGLDDYYTPLVPLFAHITYDVREAAARAVAAALAARPQSLSNTIDKLQNYFIANTPAPVSVAANRDTAGTGTGKMLGKADLSAPKKDTPTTSSIGILKDLGKSATTTKGKPTTTAATISSKISTPIIAIKSTSGQPSTTQDTTKEAIRTTIAKVYYYIGKDHALNPENKSVLGQLFEFVLNNGSMDRSSIVRDNMITAGRALIDAYCTDNEVCMHVLSSIRIALAQKCPASPTPEQAEAFDHRHEAGVVLLGAVGKLV